MAGQQLHDHDLHGSPTLRRWDNGRPWAVWDHQTIRLGRLTDGRWWITWTAPTRRPPLAFIDQDEALAAVDWVIAHTPEFTWSEVPPDWQRPGDGYGNAIPT
jgi:hypothetical protein